MVFITDFPPSQAAMARSITVSDADVAARFECYVHGKELANGYWEQIDADALSAQLQAENTRRQQRGYRRGPSMSACWRRTVTGCRSAQEWRWGWIVYSP